MTYIKRLFGIFGVVLYLTAGVYALTLQDILPSDTMTTVRTKINNNNTKIENDMAVATNKNWGTITGNITNQVDLWLQLTNRYTKPEINVMTNDIWVAITNRYTKAESDALYVQLVGGTSEYARAAAGGSTLSNDVVLGTNAYAWTSVGIGTLFSTNASGLSIATNLILDALGLGTATITHHKVIVIGDAQQSYSDESITIGTGGVYNAGPITAYDGRGVYGENLTIANITGGSYGSAQYGYDSGLTGSMYIGDGSTTQTNLIGCIQMGGRKTTGTMRMSSTEAYGLRQIGYVQGGTMAMDNVSLAGGNIQMGMAGNGGTMLQTNLVVGSMQAGTIFGAGALAVLNGSSGSFQLGTLNSGTVSNYQSAGSIQLFSGSGSALMTGDASLSLGFNTNTHNMALVIGAQQLSYADESLTVGTGGVYTAGHILPTGSNVYELGSAAMPFKDIWLGGASVYMDGTKVLSFTNNMLVFNTAISNTVGAVYAPTGIFDIVYGAFVGDGSLVTNIPIDNLTGMLEATNDAVNGSVVRVSVDGGGVSNIYFYTPTTWDTAAIDSTTATGQIVVVSNMVDAIKAGTNALRSMSLATNWAGATPDGTLNGAGQSFTNWLNGRITGSLYLDGYIPIISAVDMLSQEFYIGIGEAGVLTTTGPAIGFYEPDYAGGYGGKIVLFTTNSVEIIGGGWWKGSLEGNANTATSASGVAPAVSNALMATAGGLTFGNATNATTLNSQAAAYYLNTANHTNSSYDPYKISFGASVDVSLANGAIQYYAPTSTTAIYMPDSATNLEHYLSITVEPGANSFSFGTNNLYYSTNDTIGVGSGDIRIRTSGPTVLEFIKPFNSAYWRVFSL